MTPRGQGSGRALVKTKLLLTSALDPVAEPLSPEILGSRLGASLLPPGRGSGLSFRLKLLTLLMGTADMAAVPEAAARVCTVTLRSFSFVRC